MKIIQKVTFLTWILGGFALLFCCTNSSSSSLDLRYNEVVAQHDEVMPKIADIEVLQEKLRRKLKTVAVSDSTQKEEILKLLALLHKGHEGMFDWMNEFKNKHLNADFYENTTPQELLKYLDQEETKIIEVGKIMLEGIKQSKAYLAE